GRVERGGLPGDEHVDVWAQPRACIDEAVAHARDADVELTDDRIDCLAFYGLARLGARKELQQGSRQQDGRHVRSAQSRTSDSTAQISGRSAVIRSQER